MGEGDEVSEAPDCLVTLGFVLQGFSEGLFWDLFSALRAVILRCLYRALGGLPLGSVNGFKGSMQGLSRRASFKRFKGCMKDSYTPLQGCEGFMGC